MRILLADHHASPLWALKTMLVEEPGFEVTGEAADGNSLLDLTEKNRPDLILMDRGLPGKPLEILIASLHSIVPKLVVIVMSSDPGDGRIALRAGADAFVSKGEQPDWLLDSLRKYIKPTRKKKEENTVKDQ